MSIDLRLLPLDHDRPDWGYSHTVLNINSVSEPFMKDVQALPSTPVPASFSTHVAHLADSQGYGETQTDAYNEPIVCVTAETLSSVLAAYPFVPVAVRAYVRALPVGMRIALDWH